MATRGEAQTPPNLYEWLARNGLANLPGGVPLKSFQWYYGCASGLPGACQYVALGPAMDPTYPNLILYYNDSDLFTADGTRYSLFDAWGWNGPTPSCTGYDQIVIIPGYCRSVLPQMTLYTRVDTDWWTENPRSFRATFTPVLGASTTPEPATLGLLASGLLGVGAFATRRRRAR